MAEVAQEIHEQVEDHWIIIDDQDTMQRLLARRPGRRGLGHLYRWFALAARRLSKVFRLDPELAHAVAKRVARKAKTSRSLRDIPPRDTKRFQQLIALEAFDQ